MRLFLGTKPMAKIPNEISETIWRLKRQLADVIEDAKSAEYLLFAQCGETERTISYLNDLQSIAEQATDRFTQFSTLQIRILNVQPRVPLDMLEILEQAIASAELRLPALQRSIQEIKIEWRLL
jgi:hypothetical protein